MSRELGEAVGRNTVLERQIQEVAQIEADEIASLQQTITKLREVRLVPNLRNVTSARSRPAAFTSSACSACAILSVAIPLDD
jgi:hypothetical protein